VPRDSFASYWLERVDDAAIAAMAGAIFGGHGDEAVVREWRTDVARYEELVGQSAGDVDLFANKRQSSRMRRDHPPGTRLRPVERGLGGGSPGARACGNVA